MYRLKLNPKICFVWIWTLNIVLVASHFISETSAFVLHIVKCKLNPKLFFCSNIDLQHSVNYFIFGTCIIWIAHLRLSLHLKSFISFQTAKIVISSNMTMVNYWDLLLMFLDKYNTTLHHKNTPDEKFLRMMIVLKTFYNLFRILTICVSGSSHGKSWRIFIKWSCLDLNHVLLAKAIIRNQPLGKGM